MNIWPRVTVPFGIPFSPFSSPVNRSLAGNMDRRHPSRHSSRHASTSTNRNAAAQPSSKPRSHSTDTSVDGSSRFASAGHSHIFPPRSIPCLLKATSTMSPSSAKPQTGRKRPLYQPGNHARAAWAQPNWTRNIEFSIDHSSDLPRRSDGYNCQGQRSPISGRKHESCSRSLRPIRIAVRTADPTGYQGRSP